MGAGKDRKKPAFRIRGMVRAAVMLGAGLAVGVIIRFFDLYTTNLGNMFSEVSVWVFLGTVISVRSRTPFQAAGAVFGFCFGMHCRLLHHCPADPQSLFPC